MATKKPATSMTSLDDIVAALDPGLSPEGEGLVDGVNNPTIVMNAPLMPTEASINETRIATAAATGKVAEILPQQHAEIQRLNEALSHTENIQTNDVQTVFGKSIVTIPSDSRDIPTSLYINRKGNYGRQRADKLTYALFGKELGARVIKGAGGRGHSKMPLVWASQKLTQHTITDVEHKWQGSPFNASVDEKGDSPVLTALYTCFERLTVKNLVRTARYNNISTLDALRCIFTDILNEQRVNLTPYDKYASGLELTPAELAIAKAEEKSQNGATVIAND